MQSGSEDSIRESVERLGPWFHNLHLPGGIQTAPDHFLGDFPASKWNQLEKLIPANLAGWTCLDIGCNAGFYSFELAKRGAKVLGIDCEPLYLEQARWVAREFHSENQPEFLQMQVHDLARLNRRFDLVLFMGVFYHLRYPILALDTVAAKVNKMMIFQTLTMDEIDGKPTEFRPEEDYPITERQMFSEAGWPKMAFIEKRYSGDETNWWAPNHAAVSALLRSTGFEKVKRVAHEMYLCEPPAGGVVAARAWPEAENRAATGESQ